MAALRIATLLCPPHAAPPPPEPQGAAARGAALGPRPGEFSWTLLPRNGERPLYLPARMLLEASSRGGGCDIWSEIAVLETEDARYVAVVRHRLEARGLIAFRHATLCDGAEAVRDFFEFHDPVSVMPVEALTGPLPDCAVADAFLAAAGRESGFQRARWRALLGAVFGAPRHEPRPWAASGGLQ